MREHPSDDPILLICLGATKSGTSWFYEYLKAHPDCFLREIKEVNYFGALSEGKLEHKKVQHRRKRRGTQNMLGKCKWYELRQKQSLKRRLSDLDDWLAIDTKAPNHASYFEYLCDGRSTQKLVADITPSYMMLPEDNIRQMANVTPDVRFVYLLRDPIDRVWSHLRMNAYRSVNDRQDFDARISALTEEFVSNKNKGMRDRSDYSNSLEIVSKAVAPEKLFIGFFEDLFAPESRDAALKSITDFLGISPMPGPFDKIEHKSQEMDLDSETKTLLRRELQEQYAYCGARFEDTLPERWKQNMMMEAA